MKLIMHTREGVASVQQLPHDDITAAEALDCFIRAAIGYGFSREDLHAAMEEEVEEEDTIRTMYKAEDQEQS